MTIKTLKCSSSQLSYVPTYGGQRKSCICNWLKHKGQEYLILNQTSGLGQVLDRWYPALQSNIIHAWMDAVIPYKSTHLHL